MSLNFGRSETRYVQNGDVSIAYQVVGDGPIDLVFVPGWVSHVEQAWEEPRVERFLRRLASFSRLILFDKRGTGLSDRTADLPTLEQRMDDVRAVMDAVASEKAALFGVSEGGPMCMLFAATYPQRTTALIVYGTYAKRIWSEDYPWAPTPEERESFYDSVHKNWGGVVDLGTLAPTVSGDEPFKRWWASYLRMGASPGAALALAKMNTQVDVRHVLPAIQVPTLVLHRREDLDCPIGGSRFIAERIAGAKLIEMPGKDHLVYVGDADAVLDEVEEFLTGVRRGVEGDRVLATVLFTDIVGSTDLAAHLGDAQWGNLLSRHHAAVRKELERFRGREVDTAGDGFFATFDGPARGIRCACAMKQALSELDIKVRTGLHTGECEMIGDKVGGMAVHIGARVAAKAAPGEVLVSSTVKDLVAGSGIQFEDRGVYELKGVPDEWHLWAVRA